MVDDRLTSYKLKSDFQITNPRLRQTGLPGYRGPPGPAGRKETGFTAVPTGHDPAVAIKKKD